MSTYNGEKYLRKQIDSILKQKGNFKLEIWVRDDGSTDDTRNILNEYAEKGNLRWYTGENIGSAQSFIELVVNCTGYDYYAFSDQDDVWHPDKLERGITKIENHEGPTLYFSNARLVDAKLNDIGKNVYKKIPKTDFYTLSCEGGILGCTIIFNKELAYLLNKKIDTSKIVMHDFYIALVCKSLGGRIIYENRVTIKYRQHETNVVGVSYGFRRTIRARMTEMSTKSAVSIASQAEEIVRIYGNEMLEEKRKWLQIVAGYKKCITNRIFLALNRRVKYINFNIGLTNRIAILFGNK